MKKNYSGLVIVLILLVAFVGIGEANYQRVLQKGMKGSDVRELQENLVMFGERLYIDGMFGNMTKRAVIKFQKKSELPVDGVVGHQTWNRLKEAISFDQHQVQAGDNLSQLAYEYAVSVKVIREANNLSSNLIRIGQSLVIPKTSLGGGIDRDFYEIISYKVRRGDTLEKLSRRYHTTIRTIRQINSMNGDQIRTGQKIKIPKLVFNLPQGSGNISSSSDEFRWPVKGRISSGYGWRIHPITHSKHFHGGIDIAVGTGTNIRAAKAGKVLNSGWISGFGRTVTIDHGKGVVTLYAHNSKLLLRSGQRVSQGQVVAKSGSTGRSTGPHLDFRIIINNKTVNPLEYLK